ncbi:GFA family protein [Acidihalobacter yilgarnensis]|uniref:GFA family protein n=1 Tax=Acidihalobacter yilgarnensis TaxID=2819280 RepID=UPI0009F33BFE
MNSYSGSCFCGEVRYKINSEILNAVNCHCAFCRSHSGAAFSTYAVFPQASLEITKGEDKLTCFQADEGRKYFCGVCGTPVFNLNNRYPGVCIMYFGTLENAKTISPAINAWCESKLGWVDALSSLPSTAQAVGRQ